MKECSVCKETKELCEFYSYEKVSKSKGKYTYYHPYCKTCSIEKAKKRMYENYEDHLLKCKISHSRAEYKAKYKIYAKTAKDKGTRAKWRDKNRDKIKGYNLYRKLNKTHEFSVEEWEECKNYFDYQCAYCGISEQQAIEIYEQRLHKEHVQHDGSNGIDNCVPSCRGCNSSKSNREFSDWYNSDNFRYSEERENKIIEWLKKFI